MVGADEIRLLLITEQIWVKVRVHCLKEMNVYARCSIHTDSESFLNPEALLLTSRCICREGD
jgi:hypothetical protein